MESFQFSLEIRENEVKNIFLAGLFFKSAKSFNFVVRFAIGCIIWLIPLAASLNVTCNYRITSWSFINEHYQCHVTELRVVSQDEVVDTINGEHLPGKSANDVKSLDIDDQVCMFVPRKFESFFKNIEGIRISASSLESITQVDLQPFPNLKQLVLTNNGIIELSSDLFEHNQKLVFLDFSNNNILLIPEDIFRPIKKLESIDLTDNICITKAGHTEADIQEVVREIIASCHANNTELYEVSENITDSSTATPHVIAPHAAAAHENHEKKGSTNAEKAANRKFANKRKSKNHWTNG